jgi:hypothetical protein
MKRGCSQEWLAGFALWVMGACGGNVLQHDELAVAEGGARGEGEPQGGERGHLPPDPKRPTECTLPPFNCYFSTDVVCPWQRVTVKDDSLEYTSGGTGPELPADPCAAAELLIDTTSAPQSGDGSGGAPGDAFERLAQTLACEASYPPSVVYEPSCNGATYETPFDQCQIAGHCCVVVDVEYCGP